MAKKIAAFFKAPGKNDYPLNKNEYLNSYQQLTKVIDDLGGKLYLVRSQSTYLGEGKFSNSWQFGPGGEVVETGPIKADVVYDKGEFVTDGKVPVLNSEPINQICTDKWLTYQTFPDLCPATFLVLNRDQLEEALSKVPSQLKVVKPVDGEEGRGVFIGPSQEILSAPVEYPALVQEFIDSSGGLPPYAEGIHDFRVAILNGEPVFAYLRTPPPNQYQANVALGGQTTIVKIEDIPEQFLEIVKKVDSHMSQYGTRLYGVDMAMTNNQAKIIELNSRLGLVENARHPVFAQYKQRLAKLLLSY